ncbi:hypothetical protein LOTGIDRAFT_118343 [Lottia gigantea]|uniref:Sodium channel protein n=1 Tax=Lottia gigantea TaxID=225164 RepID=V4BZG2_LOTGI|nr:hypothetical protein LOTGIDRAFT_118343 [Lottia gigantea]ESO94539.1 hypothetical protein LOTGIDRAFT_118343 [Lottia gigantea]
MILCDIFFLFLQTFVVIAKRFKKKFIYRFSSTSAFFLLPPWNPLRQLAVRIATNQFFDYFVILTIIVNCVFMTMPDLQITETLEYIFLAIYVVEMLIKVTARGFIIDKYTYLRDGWNWLDFIVIVLAFVTILIQLIYPDLSIGNLQVLRTFRVLRALKTVSIVPGLKTIVNALLRAFKMLIDVIMLTFFCLMVFALFGLQVYQGVLRHKCVSDLPFDPNTTTPETYDTLYANHIRNISNWYGEPNDYMLCGNTSGAGGCPENFTCLPDIGDNPNYGYTNYDNFGWAILNAFQLITLDFWEDNYDKVIRASGPWNVVFFILVVFFGSFYLINLMLAVVALSYEEEAENAGKVNTMYTNEKEAFLKHQDSRQSLHDAMSYDGQLVDRNCNICSSCCRCFVPWIKFQNIIHRFITDPLLDLFITLCILMNTIIMACESHEMSETTQETIRISNYVFTSVFTLEAILKIIALSKYYFASGWNIFDFVIVLASLIDLGLEDIDGLSVFRTFRLLRVFRLAQSWSTMRILISIIVNTFGALGNLTVVLFIIIYIFAVTGLQLFNRSYTADKFSPDGIPRWNFSSFFHAAMMIFRVLCGEWIEPLYDCMRAEDELCMLVFLPALVLGNFMVLNLFLALLLNAFATDSLNKHKESNKDDTSRFKLAFHRIKHLCCCCLPGNSNVVKPDERGEEDVIGQFETSEKRDKFADFGKALDGMKKEVDLEKGEKKDDGDKDVDGLELGDTAEDHKEGEEPPELRDCLPLCCTKGISCSKSFDPSTPFGKFWKRMREACSKIVDNKIFEYGILFVIFASSVTLAFEDVHLEENQELKLALYYLNIIFCVIFVAEMLFKWFAYGLWKYFTNFWTLLDFLIVCISVASLIAESLGISNLTAFRSLRTLRALRPLRAISRLQSMRIVVNALMRAIPAIFNVFIVCMVFWLIFSIMGVQFFAGKFYKCVDGNGEILLNTVVPNKTECLRNSNYKWKNSNVNFDNVLQGYLALFQVATFEGWMEVMRDAIDSTEVDVQPKFENNIYYYLYFVAFIIFGSFFTLNLIIGVIIDNFNVLKKKYDGSYLDMFLTPNQRNYYNTLKKLGNKKPQKTIKRPKTKFQGFFFDIATSNKFELSIIVIIFLNMITLAIESYKQSDTIRDALKILNIIFTVIFILECMIKLIGMRWHYFRQFWNVFDFIIVLLSVTGLILDDLLAGVFVTPTLLRVGRVFRIGRVLRLIKAAKGLRKLLFALIISLPAIVNIGALLALIMYIYAILGMSSFKNLRVSPMMNNDIVNFQTFANSIILLFRLSTSAGWNEILDPLLIEYPDCDPDTIELSNGQRIKQTYGECGIPWLAIPYMVTYIFIAYLVIINMYIAVILENFNQAHEQEEVGITEDDFDMFYVVWERYDPLATQFIKYDVLSDFLADLEEPLGIPKPNEITIVAFNLPIVEGDKLHCLDILMALVKKHLGSVDETEESKALHKKMETKFGDIFPSRVMTVKKSTTMQRKKEDVAARTLQRCWRSFKTQKALKNITSLAMQQKTDIANQASQSRANSIISLGRRLSNALNTFFHSSRPSSALSRVSLKSNTSHHSLQPISKKSNITNTLKVPSINTLYSSGTTSPPGDTQDLYL